MTKRLPLGLLATATMVAALGAPALATSEPETDMPMPVDLIEGIEWSLLRQQVDGALVELPDGVTITILLEGGQATGYGGCNQYFGEYTLEGDALTFGTIGRTEMLCDVGSAEEDVYIASLETITNGFSTGGTLVMTGADGEPILEFGQGDSGPIPTDAIEGLTWQLQSVLLPSSAELSPVPGVVLATLLLEDGQATGNGGCNGYSASYTLDGTSLSFSQVASTKVACPEPVMEYEGAFFTQLGSVASWASDGGSVTLYEADGDELARFVPSMAS